MNQYKIEMKEIFRKEILVCAESEKEATDIVEKAYLRTNMLDHSYKDLAAVETKIIGSPGGSIFIRFCRTTMPIWRWGKQGG